MLHAVITRFNLAIKFGKGNGNTDNIDICRDITYLEERFRLFETYTFPCLIQQSSKNFIWIVMFHDETPKQFKERIEKLKCLGKGIFEPLYLTENECYVWEEVLNKYLNKKALENHYSLVATTRLDNDDAINVKYIEIIQKILKEHKNEKNYCVTFCNGLQYIENLSLLCRFRCRTNHFLTLVTSSGEVKNSLQFHHGTLEEKYKVYEVETVDPMWVEIIHGSNYANTSRIELFKIVWNQKILEQFKMGIRHYGTFEKIIIIINSIPATIVTILKRLVGYINRKRNRQLN